MVKYSSNAARALAYLKRFYNDIDIYIEDATCHNMALFIFRRILGPTIKLTSVNQLGGRAEVLKACKLDQADDGRKKLYIIDGDLDLLAGVSKPKLKYLYRLRGYCYENLIIAEGAIIELAADAEPNTPPQQLQARIDHPKWISATSQSLLALFVLYGIARTLAPTVTTVGFNVHRLCDQTPTGPVLSARKVRSRMRSLLREILAFAPLRNVRELRNRIVVRARRYAPQEYLISGKDYILPLLRAQLRRDISFYGNSEETKVRLARHYDPKREPFLTRRLKSVAGV